jgi:hypothetical protein
MKNVIVFFLWSCFLYSCKEVSYPQAQPTGVESLKEIPESLRGTYQGVNKNTGELGDTIIIERWGYRAKDNKEKDWLTSGSLSDTLVLKAYQNYFFVNFKIGNQWVLRVIQREPNGSLLFLSIDLGDDKKRHDALKKLKKKFIVKEAKTKGDVFYQINPSPEQLMNMIKEGYFTGQRLVKLK